MNFFRRNYGSTITIATMLSVVILFPSSVHAGLSGIGWLKKVTDGSGASYYVVSNSATYNFHGGTDPWNVQEKTPLAGFAFNESVSGKFSNVLVYDFDQGSKQYTSYGGHDLILPSQADAVISSNKGNPFWINQQLDINNNRRIILDQDGSPQPGEYWPNGFVLPWSGYHNAVATFTKKSDQADFPNGYDVNVSWTQTDAPPTLDSASITDSAGSTIKSGDSWNVTTGFTSMADRTPSIPDGYPTSHHYYAALWDSNNNYIKPIKLANGGFDAVGIPLQVQTFSNYQTRRKRRSPARKKRRNIGTVRFPAPTDSRHF